MLDYGWNAYAILVVMGIASIVIGIGAAVIALLTKR